MESQNNGMYGNYGNLYPQWTHQDKNIYIYRLYFTKRHYTKLLHIDKYEICIL